MPPTKRSEWRSALYIGLGSHVYLAGLLIAFQTVAGIQRFELTTAVLMWVTGSALTLSLFSYSCMRWLRRIWLKPC